jgi:hypothetical protein
MIKTRFFFISPPDFFDSRLSNYTILRMVEKGQDAFSSKRETILRAKSLGGIFWISLRGAAVEQK